MILSLEFKRQRNLNIEEFGCSQLNHNGNAEATISHNDIMNLDNERVKYIHSRQS